MRDLKSGDDLIFLTLKYSSSPGEKTLKFLQHVFSNMISSENMGETHCLIVRSRYSRRNSYKQGHFQLTSQTNKFEVKKQQIVSFLLVLMWLVDQKKS